MKFNFKVDCGERVSALEWAGLDGLGVTRARDTRKRAANALWGRVFYPAHARDRAACLLNVKFGQQLYA